MKLYLLLILFFFVFNIQFVNCQIESGGVTIIKIDRTSKSIKKAKKNGFELIDIISEPCYAGSFESFNDNGPKIPFIKSFSFSEIKDTLYLDYSLIALCCSVFESSISFYENENFILSTNLLLKEGTCRCDCCYNIRFVILNINHIEIKKPDIIAVLDGEQVFIE